MRDGEETGDTLVPEESKSPLADHVHDEILAQIVSGALDVGAKLPSENDYCRMLGVSRPIVRVALSRLGARGIVERRRGSGSYVKRRPTQRLADFTQPGDTEILLQCLEYRIDFEGVAAGLAAQRRTDEHLVQIKAAMDRLSTEADSDFITPESDLLFHQSIAAATCNVFYIDTMRMIQEQTLRLLTVSLNMARARHRGRIGRVLDEHGSIYEAVLLGDPIMATAAMRSHLSRSRRRLLEATKNVES